MKLPAPLLPKQTHQKSPPLLHRLISLGFISWIFLAISAANAQRTPDWNGLAADLEGFASQTTGGLGGTLYDVTSAQDYDAQEPRIPGTLRYAIETSSSAPLWVRFALPASSTIILKRPLLLRSNLTIDGRGSDIRIGNRIDWSEHEIDPAKTKGRPQCRQIRPGRTKGTLLSINRQQNIILTHLTFTRIGFRDSPWESSIPNLDKECLGDVLSIYNDAKPSPSHSDRIWVNRSYFQECGDGCIDITRPDTQVGRISISYNTFHDTDKTMIVGTGYDAYAKSDPATGTVKAEVPVGSFPYRVSLYGNTFENVNERNPRVSHAIAHVYRNHYSNWRLYVVYAEDALVFYEQNTHQNSKPAIQVVSKFGSGQILAWGNTGAGGAALAELPDSPNYLEQRRQFGIPAPRAER